MDSKQLKLVIFKNKSKGAQYFATHFELIKELISSGETPSSIYKALKLSECPPTISRSQFYKVFKKTGLTESSSEINQETASTVKPAISRHSALNNLQKSRRPIHDNNIDIDKLI